jgi:hypothetical protein
MTDPGMMGDMMKRNMSMILPNIGMMTVINSFFSGFVIAKFPFHVTSRFRSMVQRGVEIDNLDCSYVTSLSMYFLCLFGLSGTFKLILGDGHEDDMAMMASQQNAAGMDLPKVYKQMLEELEFNADNYKWRVPPVEALLEEKQTGSSSSKKSD